MEGVIQLRIQPCKHLSELTHQRRDLAWPGHLSTGEVHPPSRARHDAGHYPRTVHKRITEVRRPPHGPLHPRGPRGPAAAAEQARFPGPGPVPRSGRGRRPVARRLGSRRRACRLGHGGRPTVLRGAPASGSCPRAYRGRARREDPAFFIAFDALQIDGTELLALPYAERRRRLEVLFASRALTSPWTLCPQTTDPATAREWMENWTDVSGVEGLVLKKLNQRYQAGSRGWTKIRRRDSTEAVIGAITGTLARPQLLLLGRHDGAGNLRPIGRTVPLRPDAARELAKHLTLAGPGHAWNGVTFLRLGHGREPRHHARPAGSRRGDQRRHLHRPRRRLAPSDPLRAPAPGHRRRNVPRFGGTGRQPEG